MKKTLLLSSTALVLCLSFGVKADIYSVTGELLTTKNAEYGADLSYEFLEYAVLEFVFLDYANLSHSNLSGAIMTRAHLVHSDLGYANLSEAHLSSAWFHDSNLYNADLSGAVLDGTFFRDANLMGANLSDTISWWTAEFSGAYYNSTTIFPSASFDPDAAGMIFIPAPEPMTLSLLALGGLLIRKRK